MKVWKKLGICIFIAVFTASMSHAVYAQQSSSSNYGVEQAYFGSGGEIEMSSGQYKASAGLGDSASGSVEGVQFSGQTGSPTSSDPLLELVVGGGDTDHGVLNPAETVYGAIPVQVRSYNGSGYTMQVAGLPPHQSVHTIPGIETPAKHSIAGTEQFGINLRNNAAPNVGADPIQVPDSTFSYGVPAPEYNDPDYYKYVSGDIVAQSVMATGETHYTISYILNINPLTPAGRYEADLSVVVSAKF